jgi:hypothetical protein
MPNPKLSIVLLPQCLVLFVLRNNSRLELCSVCCSPSGLFCSVPQRLLVSLLWCTRLPHSWPPNSQPIPNGFEDKLSGHSHSGGSGCMIVTFYQGSLNVDTLVKYPTANSFCPQDKCTMRGTSSDFIAHLPA